MMFRRRQLRKSRQVLTREAVGFCNFRNARRNGARPKTDSGGNHHARGKRHA